MTLNQPVAADVVAELQRVASENHVEDLSQADYQRFGGRIPTWQIKKFGWNKMLVRSGLRIRKLAKNEVSDAQMFAEIRRVALSNRRETLSRFEYEKLGGCIPARTIRKRLGGWNNALVKAGLRINKAANGLGVGNSQRGPKEPKKAASAPARTREVERARVPQKAIFGEPINFRGLQHEPTNELGVVFLFGMVSKELGFLVESVQAGFPDCAAKRRLGTKKGGYVRTRIEFEFKASNFRTHRHDEKECDMIVCWENDWPSCPAHLEVLSLKEAIRNLPP